MSSSVSAQPQSAGLAGIAMGDMAFYAALLVLGGVLQWLTQSEAANLPFIAPWHYSWAIFLTTLLALYWYFRGIAMTSPGERPPLWRRVLFVLGTGAIYGVIQTRFEYMAEHMFFLNRAQHLTMHHLGPFLIALAWPGAPIMRAMPEPLRRIVRSRPVQRTLDVLQQPALAAFLFVGLLYLWLTPAVHFRAMIDPRLYDVMNWSMAVDGILFWCLLLDPRPQPPARLSFGGRAATAMAVMFPQILLGAILSFTQRDYYEFYHWCGRLYPSIDAVNDQHYGGLIVWIPAAMMSAVSLIIILNFMRIEEEKKEKLNANNGSGGIDASRWTGI